MLITRKINTHERGLVFRYGEFMRMLGPGRHWLFDPLRKTHVQIVSVREPRLVHKDLDVIVKSGALKGQAEVVDLGDRQRGLVWIDGRFHGMLEPGLHALWTAFHEVKVEVVETEPLQFEHKALTQMLESPQVARFLNLFRVEQGSAGKLVIDGRFQKMLGEGVHAFWKAGRHVKVDAIDLRRTMLDITGQEIMTADRVTLRINAVATLRVADAVKFGSVANDPSQQLYRDAQLALRAVVGARTLDDLLADKDGVLAQLEAQLAQRAATLGMEVIGLGIRDVILPGEMRDLLNKVTEARKSAEAAFISRREETAAVRSQANTARLFESNPTLMRLRELEVLEKVAEKANLSVVLGEQGLTDRVIKML